MFDDTGGFLNLKTAHCDGGDSATLAPHRSCGRVQACQEDKSRSFFRVYYKNMSPNPYAPCMEYLPTFASKITQMYVNILYMEHMGKIINVGITRINHPPRNHRNIVVLGGKHDIVIPTLIHIMTISFHKNYPL